jgi:hypothetical protein
MKLRRLTDLEMRYLFFAVIVWVLWWFAEDFYVRLLKP